MSTYPLFGEKTTLSLGGSAVAQVLSIEHSGHKSAKVDKTVLGDTVKQARNSACVDAGELTFTTVYKPGTSFSTALGNTNEQACVLTFVAADNSGESWTWAKAVVKEFKVSNIKEEGNVEGEVIAYFNDLPTVTPIAAH